MLLFIYLVIANLIKIFQIFKIKKNISSKFKINLVFIKLIKIFKYKKYKF